MLKIRPYRTDDARAMATLISATYSQFNRVEGTEVAVQGYVDHFDPNGKSEDEIRALFAQTPIRMVAVVRSRIVGVLRARGNRIVNLFVDGAFHRKGIATQLIWRYENTCQKGGLTEIVLRSSLYAIPFYEALGYKKTTGIRSFRGLKIQPMKKRLK